MAEVLNVKSRDGRGKREAKRLRRDGAIPAILYGHKEAAVSLAVPAEEMRAALRHGSRLVSLQGAVNESALIRELQWDVYGVDVMHVDFARVSQDERIEVQVPVELRGDAPGAHAGGVVQHLLHEVEVECLATAIPERIQVNVNHLELHGEISAAQLQLPEGVKLLTDPETIVVHCIEQAAEVEAADVGEGAEPEVIGRKEEPEEEE